MIGPSVFVPNQSVNQVEHKPCKGCGEKSDFLQQQLTQARGEIADLRSLLIRVASDLDEVRAKVANNDTKYPPPQKLASEVHRRNLNPYPEV